MWMVAVVFLIMIPIGLYCRGLANQRNSDEGRKSWDDGLDQ